MKRTEYVGQYLQNIGYKADWERMERAEHSIIIHFKAEPNPFQDETRPLNRVCIHATLETNKRNGTEIQVEYLTENGFVQGMDRLYIPEETLLAQAEHGAYHRLLPTLAEQAASCAWDMAGGRAEELPNALGAWDFGRENFDQDAISLVQTSVPPFGFTHHFNKTIRILTEHQDLQERLKENYISMAV